MTGNERTIRASEVPEDVETYRFMYVGATFGVLIDPAAEPATTTDPPNLHVLEGSWKTWRVEVDPDVPGLAGVRLLRSVSAGGGEHPRGNQPSGPNGNNMMMLSSDGYMYLIPTGWGLASRFYSPEEWSFLLAAWEASLPSRAGTTPTT